MIVVAAALKGGVGKTTTAVYLAAVAASNRRSVSLIDTDPQASAADRIENSPDERLQKVNVIEAPTDRLLAKALDRVGDDDVAVVDTPPGHERLLAKALDRATVAVIPTRVGGVETPRAGAVLDMMPRRQPQRHRQPPENHMPVILPNPRVHRVHSHPRKTPAT